MKSVKKKKCKVCKIEFTPVRSVQQVCNYQCAVVYADNQKQKKRRKELSQKKEELMTIPEIIKRVQQKVNQYVRMRDLGKTCVSCDQILHADLKYDAGHFYSTQYSHLRFDYSNIHGQCVKCNQHEHSNPHEYRRRIISRIGLCELQRLDETARIPVKWTREELYRIMDDAIAKIKSIRDASRCK